MIWRKNSKSNNVHNLYLAASSENIEAMSKAGKALKLVLETYGISQNQLAATMGIGRSSINRWVNENRDPASQAVLEIRKGLQQINPDAAGDFIRLYLDDLEEKLEE